jgi:hypothetical protein
MSIVENPFLNNKTTLFHIDETSGDVIELNQQNIAKYYQHIYIIVKRNDNPINPEFYNWQLSQEVLNEVSSNLLVHKTSVKVLKNKIHWDNIIVMSKEQLLPFNIFNYNLDAKNIVVPIFNIEYKNLLMYLEQFDSNNTLQALYNIKVLNKYFGIGDTNYQVNEKISNIINSLEESNYWTNYYNCLSNMTNIFKQRKFKFQSSRIKDKNIASLLNKISDKKNKISENEDYIKELDIKTNKSSKDNFIDVSSVMENKGFKLYKISQNCQFTRDDINQLFATINDKQKFLLFSNLMVSKKYCHLVVNNYYILNLMSNEIKRFAPLFRYLMSYSWIRFYFEECIKKSYVKQSDEFIFDINTASKLPVFPFNHTKPKQNPYMPILVSDEELKPYDNLLGIPDYNDVVKTIFNNQGICNLDEFRVRMNIFCTSNPNNNLFDSFNFEESKVAITGSIMTACLQKQHPLMSRFSNCDTITEQYNNFFNEYYAKSDIDVMFIAKDNYIFIDNVTKFFNQIVINICSFNSYAEPSHIKLILNKLGYLFVSEDFIEKNIHFGPNNNYTNKINYVTDNIDEDFIKEKFKPFYDQMILEKQLELSKEFSEEELSNLKIKYPDLFVTDGIDFKVYINKKFKEDSFEYLNKSNKDIDMVYTYKYKIESPYLNHNFELFPIKYDEFFSVVSRFHLPCVRAYYNGSNVYMTPSCISAHMTYMNLDYKYMAGSKDPLDIINKNRMRGFGTWLNLDEKKLFVKYSREVQFWNNLYTVNSNASDEIAAKNIFGPMSLNHKLYRPRLYNMDDFLDSVYVETTNRYVDSDLPKQINNDDSTTSEIIKRFKSISIKECNLDNFTSIDKDGHIIPLKKWIIGTVYELFSSEQYKYYWNKKDF